ncbi:MAG: putative rane protein [Pseudonocardiales bacterium]|nr:putative rane protein [Pseudonocardiales bacterium]
MDWNLRSCSRSGHVTYAADEPQYRARLEASTPLGEAWRCLRCGSYVLGPAHTTGPADDAPVLLRGRALRSAFVLRLLAVERWVRGAIVFLLGLAVFRLKSTQVSLKELFDRDLSSLQPFFNQIHFDVSDSATVHSIEKVLDAKPSTLNLVAAFLIFYGLLQVAEGVGLWLLKRWGEYFAVVATSLFLPLEVYELVEKVTWLRIVALLVNFGAVLYLLLSKRLFGLRGGHAAYEAQQHEVSLLEVEESTADRVSRSVS